MSIFKYFNRLLVILLIIPYVLCVITLVWVGALFDFLLYVPVFFMLFGGFPKNLLCEYLMDNVPKKTYEFFQYLEKHNLL